MFDNEEAFYLGTRDGDTAQKIFTQGSDQFVGFYGFASDTEIEALGVLTQDVQCSINGGNPDVDDTEDEETDDEDNGTVGNGTDLTEEDGEDDDDLLLETYAIILIAVAGAIMLVVTTSCIVYWRRAKRARAGSKI